MTLHRFILDDDLDVFVDMGPFWVDGIRYSHADDDPGVHRSRLLCMLLDADAHECDTRCDQQLEVDFRHLECKESGLPADHTCSDLYRWCLGEPLLDYGGRR